jgi:carbamoyltransferase
MRPEVFFRSLITAMVIWLKEKLYLKTLLKKELATIAACKNSQLPPLLFTEHHQAHSASAFFPSPFEHAAVLCLDGVGEWATTSVWLGEGNQLIPQWEIDFPQSLGLLYSAFTYYTGFKVNSGEYKLMGLAPYGEAKYVEHILKHLLDLKEDGTFRLNMEYFNYAVGLTMTNHKFAALFGDPPRQAEGKITQKEMDLASSIQKVTEEVVLRLARTVKKGRCTFMVWYRKGGVQFYVLDSKQPASPIGLTFPLIWSKIKFFYVSELAGCLNLVFSPSTRVIYPTFRRSGPEGWYFS